MKAKLTITMDENLIPKAKQYAKAHGCSLSYLLEKSVQSIISPSAKRISEKWRGKLSVSQNDSKRFQNLAKKYSLKEES